MPARASLPASKPFKNTHSYLSDRQSRSMKTLSNPAPATVHRDADASLSRCVGEGKAGELRALIGIEDVGLAIPHHTTRNQNGDELVTLELGCADPSVAFFTVSLAARKTA